MNDDRNYMCSMELITSKTDRKEASLVLMMLVYPVQLSSMMVDLILTNTIAIRSVVARKTSCKRARDMLQQLQLVVTRILRLFVFLKFQSAIDDCITKFLRILPRIYSTAT